MQDLLKKSEDEAVKADLQAGIDAAERVLQKANEAVDRDLLDEALEDLVARVDDWKKHKVEQFGKLLLHGVYPVLTGRADQERDVCTSLLSLIRPFWRVLTVFFFSAVRNLPVPMHPAVLQRGGARQGQG